MIGREAGQGWVVVPFMGNLHVRRVLRRGGASPQAPHTHDGDPSAWQVVAADQPETLILPEMLSVCLAPMEISHPDPGMDRVPKVSSSGLGPPVPVDAWKASSRPEPSAGI